MSDSETRPPNQALICPHCGLDCGGGKRLVAHLRHEHGLSAAEATALRPTTTWRCTLCGKEYRGAGMLTRHQQSAHGLTPLSLL